MITRPLFFFGCLLFLIIGCQFQKQVIKEPPPPSPELNENPNAIELITSDIDLFWRMYDLEKPLFTKMEVDSLYFDAGTPALSLYHQEKIKSSDAFATLLNNRFDRRYYEKVRPNTLTIQQHREHIIAAFSGLKKIYSEAVFTDIVFVMGGLDTGGTLLSNGQIVVAAEMFAKTPEMDTSYLSPWHQSVLRTPDALPVIALHELIHLQQRQFIDPDTDQTLLDRAIIEGSADFITNLVLGTFLTESIHTYAEPREDELWDEFKKVMSRSNFSEWLYNGNNGSGRPADLGYYVGFKIAESYYENASDKQQAIRDIIELTDGDTFLRKSGYDD